MQKFYKASGVLLLTGLLALAAAPANAAEATTKWASGLYATASIGQTRADMDDLAGFDVDDTDIGYSVGIGYEFNKYLAFEAGYINLGEVTATATGNYSGTYNGAPFTATGTVNLEAETDGFYFGPQVSFPVTDRLDLYAKVGLFSWDVDVKAIASGSLTYGGTVYAGSSEATASDDGTDVYFGAGLSYDVTDIITVKADWTRFNDVSDTDIDFIAAGLVFKFGKLF